MLTDSVAACGRYPTRKVVSSAPQHLPDCIVASRRITLSRSFAWRRNVLSVQRFRNRLQGAAVGRQLENPAHHSSFGVIDSQLAFNRQ
jgi:hypothetical protein